MSDIEDRLERLESLVDRQQERIDQQQETIREQRDRIRELETEPTENVEDGSTTLDRRDALKAGGLLALLFGGVGTASANPQGQVGTSSDPLQALYTAELNGPLTDGQRLDSLLGSGLRIQNGALTKDSDVPKLTVTSFDIADKSTGTISSFTVDVTVAETAGVQTDGLGLTLQVVDSIGTTVYDESLSPSELDGESTTVTFGTDGGTPELGPFDADEYTATVTADVPNVSRGTATDSFVVEKPFAGGSGTSADPYEILTWEHLDNVRHARGSSFVLVADIDESKTGYDAIASGTANGGNGFDPIGSQGDSFAGSFDGDGHVINGLTIDRGDETYVGLFGRSSDSASIGNVGLETLDVTGKNAVGGLVGYNNGTVERSYVTGSVSGTNDDVGGLVGYNGGTVERSYAMASVTGNKHIGGLVGRNYINIDSSYATGSVTANSTEVGGLVGFRVGLGNITSSYWDTESTGQSSSDGGTGLTTGQMQGLEAQNNMSDLDFSTVWATVDAENDADVSADDYPVLQALDRATQLEVRG